VVPEGTNSGDTEEDGKLLSDSTEPATTSGDVGDGGPVEVRTLPLFPEATLRSAMHCSR
jgi:hypothetical protein